MPAVGSLTMSESTAARLPSHGSSAMGLGRYFFFRFRTVEAAAAAVVTSSAAAVVEVISDEERMADEVDEEGGSCE